MKALEITDVFIDYISVPLIESVEEIQNISTLNNNLLKLYNNDIPVPIGIKKLLALYG